MSGVRTVRQCKEKNLVNIFCLKIYLSTAACRGRQGGSAAPSQQVKFHENIIYISDNPKPRFHTHALGLRSHSF